MISVSTVAPLNISAIRKELRILIIEFIFSSSLYIMALYNGVNMSIRNSRHLF